MDFGIARAVRSRSQTGHGVMIGTPEYMSPEQAESEEVDARSDIYSLGVMLFEMATGRLPFEGATALSIAMKHKQEAPPSPQAIDSRIPDDVDRLILKCLEKNPADRFQTAGELLAELDRIAGDMPATTPVRSRPPASTSRQITLRHPLQKGADSGRRPGLGGIGGLHAVAAPCGAGRREDPKLRDSRRIREPDGDPVSTTCARWSPTCSSPAWKTRDESITTSSGCRTS